MLLLRCVPSNYIPILIPGSMELLLALLTAVISVRDCFGDNSFTEKELVPGCAIDNNGGVLDVFAPLPIFLRDISLTSKPLSIADQTSWGKYTFEYFTYTPSPGSQEVQGFVKVTFYDEGTAVTLDYLRVDPNKFTQLEQALLEWSPSVHNDGKIRVKYLTSKCKCRMRVYDLTAEQVEVDGAMTKACDGTNLPRDLDHITPGCNRDDNPGVFGFGDSKTGRSFVKEFYRNFDTGTTSFEIDYGTYNHKLVNGNLFLMHLIVIKLQFLHLDYIKVKSYRKRFIEPITKGYDFTDAIYFPRDKEDSIGNGHHYIHIEGKAIDIGDTRPISLHGKVYIGRRHLYLPGKKIYLGRHNFKRGHRNLDSVDLPQDVRDGTVSLRFLMNDCTCRQRTYQIVKGGLNSVTTEKCDSFEGFQQCEWRQALLK